MQTLSRVIRHQIVNPLGIEREYHDDTNQIVEYRFELYSDERRVDHKPCRLIVSSRVRFVGRIVVRISAHLHIKSGRTWIPWHSCTVRALDHSDFDVLDGLVTYLEAQVEASTDAEDRKGRESLTRAGWGKLFD